MGSHQQSTCNTQNGGRNGVGAGLRGGGQGK